MSRLHRSDFLREVKAAFPEMRGPLNREYGLLHLEMHAFCDFTQEIIDSGDRTKAIKCFQIADRFVCDGNSAMQNAFAVSYLEHLRFDDGKVSRSWAQELLPTAVAEVYEAVKDYHHSD